MQAFSASTIRYLTADQIVSLTTATLAAVAPTTINGLTAAQTASLTTAQIAGLITDQYQAISKANVQALTLEQMAAMGLDRLHGLAMLERQITVQAQTISVGEFYLLCGIGYLCLIVLVWFSRPASGLPKESPPPALMVE